MMHVDLDAFYASCELARNPQLRGLPVIVGGQGRSVVLAATYEARALGVKSAMPLPVALRACPQAIVMPPDFRLYSYISKSIFTMMREITPDVEQVSIDEAFLDVKSARRRLGLPTEIGARLRAVVEAKHGVTCSVGIAENKMVAKLASTHAKPNGMLLVPAAATQDFMLTLPVGALWGVGDKGEAALARFGITQVSELFQLDLPTLQSMVGNAFGLHLYHLARGRDFRGIETGRVEHSISNETTFAVDQTDLRVVESRVLALCDQVAGRLRASGQVARTLAVKVRISDFSTANRSRTLSSPTDLASEMYPVAQQLLESVDLRGQGVRLVGVRAEHLLPRDAAVHQPTLEQAVQARDYRSAELALDQVRAKFGRQSARLGATLTTETR